MVKELKQKHEKMLKDYILREICKLDNNIFNEQECDAIISYRTFAIILNNRFGYGEYLKKFDEMLLKDNFNRDSLFKKINLNFHLLYYSQTEFTYNDVEDCSILFEPEVSWNTYQVLKNSINSKAYNAQYIETCIITLIFLIMNIHSKRLNSKDVFSDTELDDCMNCIISSQKNNNLWGLNDLIVHVQDILK